MDAGLWIGIGGILLSIALYFRGRRDGRLAERSAAARERNVHGAQSDDIEQRIEKQISGKLQIAFPEKDFSTPENRELIASASASAMTALRTYAEEQPGIINVFRSSVVTAESMQQDDVGYDPRGGFFFGSGEWPDGQSIKTKK